MKHFLLFALAGLAFNAPAQTGPGIEWHERYGGSGSDEAWGMAKTPDGGYVLVGATTSSNGIITGQHGGRDMWVVKVDEGGTLQWQRTLGGSLDESGQVIVATDDGGYAIIGSTHSNDGDVTGNHGEGDAWLVKLQTDGMLEWQLALGGSEVDVGWGIVEMSDGSLAIVGETRSNDGDVTGSHGGADAWLAVVDGTGALDWQRCLGGSGYDIGLTISITASGEFLIGGETGSTDGDVIDNDGGLDGWLVRVNSLGEVPWQRCLGGSMEEILNKAIELTDGSILAAGIASSNDGDVSGHHGNLDGWIVRLDAAGEVSWQYALGGAMADFILDIEPTSDGGCVAAGWTQSSDGDVTNFLGVRDTWLVRFNAQGDLLWERTYGGSDNDGAYAVRHAGDGGYALLSTTRSVDGETGTGFGIADYWLLKTEADPVGLEERTVLHETNTFPNPTGAFVQVELGSQTPVDGSVTGDWFDATGRHLGTAIPMPHSSLGGTLVYLIQDLPSGLLMLRIRSGDATYLARVVKL